MKTNQSKERQTTRLVQRDFFCFSKPSRNFEIKFHFNSISNSLFLSCRVHV
ncbi:Uncharacterized protein APZ42_034067 [Daphnia magna]|uniref:Uncharacterized protein n=1 Tax=Daphnia magna TaxID=35525 RepID=A0A164KFD8_9CRUS|nr:Uncharacterized protein APZ42_034067 [Daphnia magna]